ncbi:MAG: hypothetical protein KJ601_03060 [Nanoarchaeota archaeon]|nr:hypothetical protein [Nanoarchaeota archaeon]MBU1703766.1 hypothetical protein [Nanoarchaeota archaeon]
MDLDDILKVIDHEGKSFIAGFMVPGTFEDLPGFPFLRKEYAESFLERGLSPFVQYNGSLEFKTGMEGIQEVARAALRYTADSGISMSQIFVSDAVAPTIRDILLFLYSQDKTQVGELSRKTGNPATDKQTLLDRLEKIGFALTSRPKYNMIRWSYVHPIEDIDSLAPIQLPCNNYLNRHIKEIAEFMTAQRGYISISDAIQKSSARSASVKKFKSRAIRWLCQNGYVEQMLPELNADRQRIAALTSEGRAFVENWLIPLSEGRSLPTASLDQALTALELYDNTRVLPAKSLYRQEDIFQYLLKHGPQTTTELSSHFGANARNILLKMLKNGLANQRPYKRTSLWKPNKTHAYEKDIYAVLMLLNTKRKIDYLSCCEETTEAEFTQYCGTSTNGWLRRTGKTNSRHNQVMELTRRGEKLSACATYLAISDSHPDLFKGIRYTEQVVRTVKAIYEFHVTRMSQLYTSEDYQQVKTIVRRLEDNGMLRVRRGVRMTVEPTFQGQAYYSKIFKPLLDFYSIDPDTRKKSMVRQTRLT